MQKAELPHMSSTERMKIQNLLNPKETAPVNLSIQQASQQVIGHPEPIYYSSGTKKLGLQTGEKKLNASVIGSGCSGKLFNLLDQDGYVVKKTLRNYYDRSDISSSFNNEWKIGRILNGHPNFLEMGNLYIKQSKTNPKLIKQKLVMKKVEGDTLDELNSRDCYLSKKELTSLLNQLLTVTLYIYKKNICFRDICDENIMVERKDSLLTLKMIDYELWFEIDESDIISYEAHKSTLFFNLIDGIDFLLNCSDLPKQNDLNPIFLSIGHFFKISYSNELNNKCNGEFELSNDNLQHIADQLNSLPSKKELENLISSFMEDLLQRIEKL